MTAAPAQLVVRYHEIALKGKNRSALVELLRRNLRAALGPLVSGGGRLWSGRIGLPLRDPGDWPAVRERVARLCGVANFSLSVATGRSLPELFAAVERHWPEGQVEPRSFRVVCRRADKRFELTSPELERALGALVHERRGLRVDLERPELTLWVEVLSDRFHLSFDKLPGAGGLPSGSSEPVLALLSGGIDSPVAAWRIARRGAPVHCVHFSGQPFHDRTGERKALELARVLARSQGSTSFVHVAFGEVQRRVVVAAPARLRIVLYRRLMLRIAERLAAPLGALALCTGESLGQVASQTLSNLTVIAQAVQMPVLRPLVGMDKLEIVEQARALGTYETSILPDLDCCQLFVPPRPATHARLEHVLEVEQKLDVPALVQSALDAAAPPHTIASEEAWR